MKLLAWLMSSALICVVAGIIILTMIIRHYSADLPDVSQLQSYTPKIVSRVHAGDGRLMAEFAAERRIFVPVNRIPQRVIDAFLSAEDKNFYTHSGIDFMGLARAVVINVQNIGQGRRPVGASTITQQITKNFLLTNEVSISRKIKEAILSFRIERAYTKDEILELYLNEIFLGQRAYGVAAASLAYFNKTLDELTIAEAAYLAVLPKAPNNYHPERNKKDAYERRNWVLSRLLEDGRITQPEYEQALAEPITLRPRSDSEFYQGGAYFTEEIRKDLLARYGDKAVLEGGLLVRATMDPRLQDIGTKALRDGLIAYDRRHGWRGPLAQVQNGKDIPSALKATSKPIGGEAWLLAAVTNTSAAGAEILLQDDTKGLIPLSELKWARAWKAGQKLGADVKKTTDVLSVGDVVLVAPLTSDKKDQYSLQQMPKVQGALVAMDAHTGRVLAMVGGFSTGVSVFNRATQAMRQPGSSFKPFVYLTALDSGFTPSSLVLDAPISLSQGAGLPPWTPGNYTDDYLGPTTLRVGMEKSRNVMTVRLAMQVGIDNVGKTADAFGVFDHMQRNLSMALGAGETTVLRMTNAYAQIVNGGKQISPSFIDSIQDKEGHILYRHDTRPCVKCNNVLWSDKQPVPNLQDTRAQLVDPRSAYQMVHILEGVIERGTGGKARGLPWPLAGKTGTTNDERDAWFVGFSADMTVGLYVGFDQPTHLGHKETGGSIAAPIFRNFMEKALEGTPPVNFRVPSGLRMVKIDPRTGHLADPSSPSAIWEAYKPGTEPSASAPESVIDPSSEGMENSLPTSIDMGTTPTAPSSDAPSTAQPPSRLPSENASGEIY